MISSASAGLLSLLPILAGGYLILRANFFRYWMAWLPGRYLYFNIAIAGLLMFILAAAIESHVDLSILRRILGEDHQQFFLPVLVALLLRLIFDALFFAMSKWNPETEKQRVLKAIGSKEFERFIYKAIDERRLIMATLEAGKVYIGLPLDTFSFADPDTGKKFLRLLPLESGYRDEKQRYEKTTIYSPAFEKMKKENPELDFKTVADNLQVVVPVRQIISVHLFDPDLYKTFHAAKSAGNGHKS